MIVKTTRELRREITDWWGLMASHASASAIVTGEYDPRIDMNQAEQLTALGDDPTFEQIAEIIGHKNADYFCTIICAECGKKVDRAVEIDSYDYKDSSVCADCLREALRMLGEYPPRYGHWTPQP